MDRESTPGTSTQKNSAVLFRTLFLAVVLLAMACHPLHAQLREYPDESLAGIKGVRVVVRYSGPEEQAAGLSMRQLQSQVEVRLNVDNVKVLTDSAWNRTPGRPYFSVVIVGTQVGSPEKPMFFFSIATDLIQEVSLRRTPSYKTDGSTWNQDYSIVVDKDHLRDVTVKIGEVAHDFAESVHAANM